MVYATIPLVSTSLFFFYEYKIGRMPYKTTTVDPALLVLKPTFIEIVEVELRHHLVGLSRAHPLACVHVYICVGFCIGRMWGLVNVLNEDPNDLM